MNLLHNDIKRELAGILQTALQAVGLEESIEKLYNQLGQAPDIKMGHLAFPCFQYAKQLRKGPPLIAKEIAENLPANDLIEQARPTGPYLNFSLTLEAWGKFVAQPILSGAFFSKELTENSPKTMVEYSQPNTHKELHVGHMRNLALGDAVIKMHRYCGYDIISATFPGDVGTHVAKCLWYMKDITEEEVPEENKGVWLGHQYVNASRMMKEIEGTPAETTAKSRQTEILKQLEEGEGEFYDLWKETREWSIAEMKKAYDWADVTFDAWYWESDVDAQSVAYARKLFAEGKLSESKGAIGMDLEEEKLGFAMALKSDGTGLYLTKDMELARRKFEDFGIEKSVYIVDKRQERHFKQVFKVLEKLGFEQAKNCYHLKYDYVEGKTGTFSSRDGNAVPLMDLIVEMEKAIYNSHQGKLVEEGKMEEAEARLVSETVAKGAIKYGMVKIDTQKKIVFDMDEWIRISGNSGPYQQYVCARINSLLAKQGYQADGPVNWASLHEDAEVALLVKASEYNDVVLNATQKFQTHLLTNYLYDLSKALNGFYNDISIRDTENEVLKNTRMALLKMVERLVNHGLSLLGIQVPDRM